MDIKYIANWLRGYLESLSHNDNISKQRIQILMPKLDELVSKIEEYKENYDRISRGSEDKDLTNKLYGYLESLSYNNNISKEQIQIFLPKMEALISKIEYKCLNFPGCEGYKYIANSLRGHLESLSYNDYISKQQIQILLPKVEELISEIEKHENGGGFEEKHMANRLYGYLESLSYSKNISNDQTKVVIPKIQELVSEIQQYVQNWENMYIASWLIYEQSYYVQYIANWLRGYLESLSYSDKISKEQIQIILPEIENLFSTIKDNKIHDRGIADRLGGYLESLSNSDNISKQQIQILLTKIEELVSVCEEYENGSYEDDQNYNNANSQNANRFDDPIDIDSPPGEEDDLPF